jgi:ribosomal protein RSM22 (predicted rRNA methylase)
VTLPPALQTGIDELVAVVDKKRLERAARRLSDAYRAGGPGATRATTSAEEVAAYLATRAPATYAAVAEVFRQIRLVRPDWAPTSVLDLGAGPAVASWAAVETWPGGSAGARQEAEPGIVGR